MWIREYFSRLRFAFCVVWLLLNNIMVYQLNCHLRDTIQSVRQGVKLDHTLYTLVLGENRLLQTQFIAPLNNTDRNLQF